MFEFLRGRRAAEPVVWMGWEGGSGAGRSRRKHPEGQGPGQRRSVLLRVRGETLMGGKDGSFSHL